MRMFQYAVRLDTKTRSKLTPTEWDIPMHPAMRQSISRHQQQINQNVTERGIHGIMLISQFKPEKSDFSPMPFLC